MPNIRPALKQSYLFWFGIGLATCALVFGGLGLSYEHLESRFASEGVPADAVVVAKEKENNPNSDPRYIVEFGFVDTQGKAVRGRDAIPQALWDELKIDQKAPIEFLRSEPETVRLKSPLNKHDGKVQLEFAAWGGGLGVLLMAAALYRILKSWSA